MTVPPGWYDDPDLPGYVRWWDGERWADMTAPRDLVPQPPSTTQKVAGVVDFLVKAWFLLLALGVLVLVIWILL